MPSTTDDFSRLRPGWLSVPVGKTVDLRNVTGDLTAYDTETVEDSYGDGQTRDDSPGTQTVEKGSYGQHSIFAAPDLELPKLPVEPRNQVGLQQNFDQGLASLRTGQNLMDLNEGLEPTPLMPPQQGGGPVGFLRKLINIAVMMSPAGKAITIGKILQQLQQAPDKMVFIKKLGTNLAQMVARNKLGADRFDLA